jgi:hypothetical protein
MQVYFYIICTWVNATQESKGSEGEIEYDDTANSEKDTLMSGWSGRTRSGE